jgi:hypothetical protein
MKLFFCGCWWFALGVLFYCLVASTYLLYRYRTEIPVPQLSPPASEGHGF